MLSKKFRILKNDIPNIVRRGKKFQTVTFDMKIWWDDSLEHPLFAVIVSKKVEKSAVVRNTIKRKFKAAIYELLMQEVFKKGKYIFLIRDSAIVKLKSSELAASIKKVIT